MIDIKEKEIYDCKECMFTKICDHQKTILCKIFWPIKYPDEFNSLIRSPSKKRNDEIDNLRKQANDDLTDF